VSLSFVRYLPVTLSNTRTAFIRLCQAMTAVEIRHSQPEFHLRRSSEEHHHLSSPEHFLAEREPDDGFNFDSATNLSHGQLYAGNSHSLKQNYNSTNEYHHDNNMAHQTTGLYPSAPNVEAQQHFQNTAHQQAWQQAYQGMLAAATPSFEDTRSSTPLASHPNIGQLRSASASSVTSNNASSSASTNGTNSTFHPYRRQPGNIKRSRSSDNSLSNSSRTADSVSTIPNRQVSMAPSVTSPSDTTIQTPNTIEQYRERARVESNGSTDSRSTVSERGKIGVAVRAGRIPVPKMMDVAEGMQVAQGQRSVSTPVAQPPRNVEMAAFNRSSSNDDLSNQNPSSANQFSHKRQSSSTSSVGAVVRSTLGQGSNSTFATGTSASTPPSLVIASSSLTTPLAPVVSPERPVRTMNDVQAINQSRDKSESASSGGGLKGRLQRALNKNSEKEKPRAPVISAPVGEMRQGGGLTASASAPSTLPQPTGSTGRSVSNPQQQQSQQHPGLGNRRPSNSSFAPSFIEPLNGNAGKGKRNLFSMRNASTDNISIGSTVSSASMMIRKMGALGKLARRNRFVDGVVDLVVLMQDADSEFLVA
jgi:hypothetical protein